MLAVVGRIVTTTTCTARYKSPHVTFNIVVVVVANSGSDSSNINVGSSNSGSGSDSSRKIRSNM